MSVTNTPQKREKSQLKTLLLQIRDSPQVREEELQSFAALSGLDVSQIDVLNVFDTPDFPATAADDYDALWVGGASEANVLKPKEFPFIEPSLKLIHHCAETGLPVFASCFGFQLAVLALGGEILHKDADFEMGSLPVLLTPSAATDPLFYDISGNFLAISVHRQYAAVLPPNCQLLAYTEQCMHCFRVEGREFWAFQFHPEVDRDTLVERLTFYKAHYTDGDGQLEGVLNSARETPVANALPRRFVDRVLLA